MSERRYTVSEIDALRLAVESNSLSRCFTEDEKVAVVWTQVRDHMAAGHTAEDVYAAERTKAMERSRGHTNA